MKIVGFLVCGPNEADRYLEETLKDFKRLCDDAVVCLNNAGKKEEELVDKYGFWHYPDNREWGKHQNEIKDALLARVRELNPDWILPLDADETMPGLDRKALEELTANRHALYFYVVNLWNDEDHYARDLSFWNIRFYQNYEAGMSRFQRTPLHCGLAPPYFYKVGTYVPQMLFHKGLMEKSSRERKVERYNQYDPNAKYKSRLYYDALKVDSTGSSFNPDEVSAKLNDYCANLNQKRYI